MCFLSVSEMISRSQAPPNVERQSSAAGVTNPVRGAPITWIALIK